MINIKSFTFNPFEENTYLVWDEKNECIIIDPGCFTAEEKRELEEFISTKKLKPVKILLTHTHIDHILGNNFISGKFNVPIQVSFIEKQMLHAASEYGKMWGIEMEPSPEATLDISETENIKLGNNTLEPIFTPGHSPGSFSFYHAESKNLFSGDVLFQNSIGRTDLPGGDYTILMNSITGKILTMDDDVKVHPGHGPSTTIGIEKSNNPFLV